MIYSHALSNGGVPVDMMTGRLSVLPAWLVAVTVIV